jgi:hypothetical protein
MTSGCRPGSGNRSRAAGDHGAFGPNKTGLRGTPVLRAVAAEYGLVPPYGHWLRTDTLPMFGAMNAALAHQTTGG